MNEAEQRACWRQLTRNTAYIALSTGAKAAMIMFVFVATVLVSNLLQT